MEGKAIEYLDRVRDLLTRIETRQAESISAAARRLAEVVERGGIIHTFGSGHSHCAAEDIISRTGGLAAVNLVYEPSSAGELGMFKASVMEQLAGVGETAMRFSGISKKDALIVVSNSGLNNAPVEAALYGRELGIPVVAITSATHYSGRRSRHSGGKKLMEVADFVLDTGVPYPDSAVQLEGLEQPVGGLSTVVAIVLEHMLCVSIAALLLERGVQPDVFYGGNMENADEHNLELWKKYRDRVRIF